MRLGRRRTTHSIAQTICRIRGPCMRIECSQLLAQRRGPSLGVIVRCDLVRALAIGGGAQRDPGAPDSRLHVATRLSRRRARVLLSAERMAVAGIALPHTTPTLLRSIWGAAPTSISSRSGTCLAGSGGVGRLRRSALPRVERRCVDLALRDEAGTGLRSDERGYDPGADRAARTPSRCSAIRASPRPAFTPRAH